MEFPQKYEKWKGLFVDLKFMIRLDRYEDVVRSLPWENLTYQEQLEFINILPDLVQADMVPLGRNNPEGYLMFDEWGKWQREASEIKKRIVNDWQYVEIREIKNGLQLHQTKTEKINYLNRTKTNYLQGENDPLPPPYIGCTEVSKDLIFEYINHELEYWNKYIEDRTKTSKGKPPPADLNKPKLNQKQIAILLRFFFDKHIFTRRDLTNKDFAFLISQFSGYSPNPMRQDFSAKSPIELSDNISDYDEIIESLNQVIQDIKNSKGQIS